MMSIPAVITAEAMQHSPDIDGKVLFTAVNTLPTPGDFVHVHITDCIHLRPDGGTGGRRAIPHEFTK